MTSNSGIKSQLALHELNWRIDTKIVPHSQWQILIAMLWGFVMILIVCFSNLAWWQWLLLALIMVITAWLYHSNSMSQRFPVVHITQPPFTELYQSPWFVHVNITNQTFWNKYYSNTDNEGNNEANNKSCLQLWQGLLTGKYVNRYLVVLHFDIIEPKAYQYSVMIWRDQVNEDAWRQLQVFARL